MIHQLRFHGRGGEGVKLASRIVTRAGFLAGMHAQDSPLYGAERRGAPVVASARIGDEPARERGYVTRPDALALADASLLGDPQAAVLDGADASTAVLVNSARAAEEIRAAHAIAGPVATLDLSAIAQRHLGDHLPAAPLAAFALRALRLATWEIAAAAVRIEIAAIGVGAARLEANLAAAEEAFARATALERPPRGATLSVAPEPVFVLPALPAREAAPSIDAGATSELRRTSGWRVHRPVIELARCTRCFLCFALCPEGAIRLDEENFPVVDYDHCKGCLVCVAECPTETIRAEREVSA